VKAFFRQNGLSLVLFGLFLVFITGQALTGWHYQNEENREHNVQPVSLASYLSSGAFGEAVFENWESEFLQMGVYVLLTVFLFQKGSSESKDPNKKEPVDADPLLKRYQSDAPAPVRHGGLLLVLYKHSLSLAFILLFAISFSGHAFHGTRAFNEEALLHGQPTATVGQYITSSQFWFESFQNWQSEFLAIFAIVILSIWLREQGSPESKPVATPHHQTGE
jgi:hypothetical protein